MMKKWLPLIIVLLVAGGGIGAYFLLKKKSSDASDTSGASPAFASEYEEEDEEEDDIDINDTDDIIEATSMTSAQKTKAKNWVKNISKNAEAGTSGWSESKLSASAQSAGITYAQQLVVSSLWQMYSTQGYITQADCKKFTTEVKSL